MLHEQPKTKKSVKPSTVYCYPFHVLFAVPFWGALDPRPSFDKETPRRGEITETRREHMVYRTKRLVTKKSDPHGRLIRPRMHQG